MITYEEARRLALDYLSKLEEESRKVAELRRDLTPRESEILILPQENDILELGLVEEATIEVEFGWVFFCAARGYLETEDDRYALVGNAPILISRRDGSLHETGAAYPIEVSIENFKRTGNTQE